MEGLILDEELFLNDHEAVAARLRAILSLAERAGVAISIFELEPEAIFGSFSLDNCRIDADVLENILKEHDLRRNGIKGVAG